MYKLTKEASSSTTRTTSLPTSSHKALHNKPKSLSPAPAPAPPLSTRESKSKRDQQRKTKATAQMSILGRDGSDLEFGASHRERLLETTDNNRGNKKKDKNWLTKLFDSSKQQQKEKKSKLSLGDFVPPPPPPPPKDAPKSRAPLADDDDTTTFDDDDDEEEAPPGAVHTPRTVDTFSSNEEDDIEQQQRKRRILVPPRKMAPRAARAAIKSIVSSAKDAISSKATASRPPRNLLEDEVARDCHFFYRGMSDNDDDNDHSDDHHDDHGDVLASSSVSSPSSDLEEFLPFRHRAAFKARYQQLNSSNIQDELPDDLYLFDAEDDTSDLSQHQPAVADFSLSSLYYYTHDGKVLMKLPKDKVKLLMDPNLEPGILSVVTTHDPNNTPTPLYVMTVDPDLYKRVVQEIRHNNNHLSSCCCGVSDKPHADIRIAWLILGAIFLLLLISTFIWPLD